ncbi:thiamine phosphate synthase [Sinomicrobium sp. M5D2P9]
MSGLIVITKPETSPDDTPDIIRMFQKGLAVLHLRKPEMNRKEMAGFLNNIPEIYHPGIVIHSHYELRRDYHVKGIHLPEGIRENGKEDIETLPDKYRNEGFSVSTSFHSLEILRSYGEHPFNYAFLSPVFDSISKAGYKGRCFDISGERISFPVIALGGITPGNISDISKTGFSGAAVLGYIWHAKNPVKAFSQFPETAPDIINMKSIEPVRQ